MDLEAQTLSELRFVYAPSVYMGFGSRCYYKYGFVHKQRTRTESEREVYKCGEQLPALGACSECAPLSDKYQRGE